MIADVALPVEKVDAFNRMEKLRDPSHTQALSYDAWEGLLKESGLKDLRRGSYLVGMELEKLLKVSFPKPGDEEKIRDLFRKDIGADSLGMAAQKVGSDIHFSYPIAIYAGDK